MCGNGFVVARDHHHSVVGMSERMNLDHCSNHIARNQGVTHAGRRLHDAIADVAYGKDTGFATCLEDAVAHLGDQWFEMEGTRVPHAPSALHQYLWLRKIFLRPVHSQTKSVSLMVVRAEFLASQFSLLAGHDCSPCSPL